MSYDPEKNRIKVTKFRTRKGLEEAGYGKDEIKTIFAGVNWADVTPVEVLSLYTATQEEPRARGSRPPRKSPETAREPRQVSRIAATVAQEEPEEESNAWGVWGFVALGVIILGVMLYAFFSSAPTTQQ